MEALGSRLCRDCGLCCDGSFFARVPLAEGETVASGLVVLENPLGGRYLPQPCRALQGGACACYEARPRACREYRCVLVTACMEGEVSLREALRTVARARDVAESEDEGAREDFFAFTFGRR